MAQQLRELFEGSSQQLQLWKSVQPKSPKNESGQTSIMVIMFTWTYVV